MIEGITANRRIAGMKNNRKWAALVCLCSEERKGLPWMVTLPILQFTPDCANPGQPVRCIFLFFLAHCSQVYCLRKNTCGEIAVCVEGAIRRS